MSFVIRLENLPWSAESADIRHFFDGIKIPGGGVHVVGGVKGTAFIKLRYKHEVKKAMLRNGFELLGNPIKLSFSDHMELKDEVRLVREGFIDEPTEVSDKFHIYDRNTPSPGRIIRRSSDERFCKESLLSHEIQRRSPDRNIQTRSPSFERDFRKRSPDRNILTRSPSFKRGFRKRSPNRNIRTRSPSLKRSFRKSSPDRNIQMRSPSFERGFRKSSPDRNIQMRSPSFERGFRKSSPDRNIRMRSPSFERGFRKRSPDRNIPTRSPPFERGFQKMSPGRNIRTRSPSFERGFQKGSPDRNIPTRSPPFERGFKKMSPGRNIRTRSPSFERDFRKRSPDRNIQIRSPSFERGFRKMSPDKNIRMRSPSFEGDFRKRSPDRNIRSRSHSFERGFLKMSPDRNIRKRPPRFKKDLRRKASPLERDIRKKSPDRIINKISSEHFAQKISPNKIIRPSSFERFGNILSKESYSSHSPVTKNRNILIDHHNYPPHQRIEDIFQSQAPNEIFNNPTNLMGVSQPFEPAVSYVESTEIYKKQSPGQSVFNSLNEPNVQQQKDVFDTFSKYSFISRNEDIPLNFSSGKSFNSEFPDSLKTDEFASLHSKFDHPPGPLTSDFHPSHMTNENLRLPGTFPDYRINADAMPFDFHHQRNLSNEFSQSSPKRDEDFGRIGFQKANMDFKDVEFRPPGNRDLNNDPYNCEKALNRPPNYCLKLSGFKPDTKLKEVQQVLKKVFAPQRNIKWEKNNHGYKTGVAYVKVCNEDDFNATLHGPVLFFRENRIEVSRCPDEICWKMFPQNNDEYETDPKDLVFMLKGLPFASTEHEIVSFFKDLKLVDVLILYNKDGKAIGTGYVEFDNLADYRKALERNGKKIGHRYIELLKSCRKEMAYAKSSAVSVNKPFKTDQQKTFFESPILLKPTGIRPLCLIVSGLPLNIRSSQIYEFFAECHPYAIHVLLNNNQHPIGQAYVEFFDPFEFNTALKQTGQYIGMCSIVIKQVSCEDMTNVLDSCHALHLYTNKKSAGHSSSPVPEKVPYLWEPPGETDEPGHKLRRTEETVQFWTKADDVDAKEVFNKYDDYPESDQVKQEENVQIFDYSHGSCNVPPASVDVNPVSHFKHDPALLGFDKNMEYTRNMDLNFNKNIKYSRNIDQNFDKSIRYPININQSFNPHTTVSQSAGVESYFNPFKNNSSQLNAFVTTPAISDVNKSSFEKFSSYGNKGTYHKQSENQKFSFSKPIKETNFQDAEQKTVVKFGMKQHPTLINSKVNNVFVKPEEEKVKFKKISPFRGNRFIKEVSTENIVKKKFIESNMYKQTFDKPKNNGYKGDYKIKKYNNDESQERSNNSNIKLSRGEFHGSRAPNQVFGKSTDINKGGVVDPQNAFGKPGCIIQVSNVNTNAGLEELLNFFQGFELDTHDIIRKFTDAGVPTEDIRVAFRSHEEAQRAICVLNYRNLRGVPIRMNRV